MELNGKAIDQNKWTAEYKAEDHAAEIFIYGVVSDGFTYDEETDKIKRSETSAKGVKKILDKLKDDDVINIYINSQGGSVFEGLAIYNMLKRCKQKKNVYIDGMAYSIASVIAMAGDQIVMPENATLMIHNAITYAYGNAAEMRKTADELEIINESIRSVYRERVSNNVSDEELKRMMDNETFISAKKALELGFITNIPSKEEPKNEKKAEYKNMVANFLNRNYAQYSGIKEETKQEPIPENTGYKGFLKNLK